MKFCFSMVPPVDTYYDPWRLVGDPGFFFLPLTFQPRMLLKPPLFLGRICRSQNFSWARRRFSSLHGSVLLSRVHFKALLDLWSPRPFFSTLQTEGPRVLLDVFPGDLKPFSACHRSDLVFSCSSPPLITQ